MGLFNEFDLGKFTDLWDEKMTKEQCRRTNEQLQILLLEKRLVRFKFEKCREQFTQTEPYRDFIDAEIECICLSRAPRNAYTGPGTCYQPTDPINNTIDYNKKLDFVIRAHDTDYDPYPDRNEDNGDKYIYSLIVQRNELLRMFVLSYEREKLSENK